MDTLEKRQMQCRTKEETWNAVAGGVGQERNALGFWVGRQK